MCGIRVDRLVAGAVLAVFVATASAPAFADSQTEAAIEALVPVPEPAGVAPLTAADIGATAPARTEPAPAQPATASKPLQQDQTTAAPPVTAATSAGALDQKGTDKAAVAAPPEQSVDQQIAERLRTVLAKPERKKDRALDAFYSSRNYAPLWIDHGVASERAKKAAAFLAKVDADGLDPADYPVPEIKAGADIAALAEAELKFSSIVLTFAHHAQTGRIHYSRISADIYYNQTSPEPADVLAKLADAKDAGAALDGYNPQHPGYKALKAKLAEIRAQKSDARPKRIEHGEVLKIAKDKRGKEILLQDARVPQLRERLGVAGDPNDTTYDKALAEAVKKFQKQHDLAATGSLTSATINALNSPKRDRDSDIIIANMERWRWLPHDLGKTYVMVNIPDFTLKVVSNDHTVWTTRIVTGKPGRMATPLLSETMKYITVNPTWNVPPSIINNEYLPALQQDPTVLERMGLKLEQNRDGTVHIYQPPGERNALGRIRFNFPNKFLVYQHDTPDKNLFAHETRAFSHGCMRVQNPDRYAEVLLSLANPKDGYTVDRIHKMYGTGERDIHLQTPIPVHLTYQTAFVDDAGKLVLRPDIYGRDARILAVLKGDERKVADVAVENRDGGTSARPARLPETFSFGTSYASGSSFFERLFGGGGPAPVPRASIPQRRQFAR